MAVRVVSYLGSHRYGLTREEPSTELRASGWRQAWRHPSGLLALRHPSTGHWVVSDGYRCEEGWSSSLRAVALKIERMVRS